MIEADRDTVADVKVAVFNLRTALDSWIPRSLAELIAVAYGGEVRGEIDLGTLEDVVLSLDYDLEYLSLKVDALCLLLKFITSPSS